MPGSKTEQVVAFELRTKQVEASFSARDEDTLLANAGKWPDGYIPSTVLRLYSQPNEVGKEPTTASQVITVGPGVEGMDPELLEDYKAAVLEFFTMPKAHILAGKIMRGELIDGPGLVGEADWRNRFAGTSYNMHDGSGEFVITAVEEEEEEE